MQVSVSSLLALYQLPCSFCSLTLPLGISVYIPEELSTGLCKSKWIVVFSKWDFLREGNGNPLLYSYLENPMHRGAWRAMAHGVAKSWTRLSNFTHSLTHMGFVLGKVLRFMLALLTSISMSWWNMLPQHSSVKKQFSYLAQRLSYCS